MKKNWTNESVDKFIKPEANQKSPKEFIETHVEIDKIEAEILRPKDVEQEGGGTFVSESELRDAILKSDLKEDGDEQEDNRIFIIKGETGSGKSHLCQWLEYQINSGEHTEDHKAIHISRSDTRLDTILEELYRHLDGEEHENVGSLLNLDPEDVADFVVQGLKTFHSDREALKDFDLETFIEEREKKTDLRHFIEKNLREYQQSVKKENKEQQFDLLPKGDYREVCLMAFNDAGYADDKYAYIRHEVNNLVTTNLGIDDFGKELEEVCESYINQGARPVLICEDLTVFSALKDELLDSIFELSNGHYDIVLGWTTGWEDENIDDALTTSEDSLSYMKERAEGYLSMTDDRRRAYFLEDESAPVKIVRSYLETIKEESRFGKEVDVEGFDGLYPFNEAFIRYAYEKLQSDEDDVQKTPRLLLVQVIADCLKSDRPPYETIEENAFIRDRPSIVDIKYTEEHQNLAKWYGVEENEEIIVPEGILDAFGVKKSEINIEDGIASFERQVGIGGGTVLTRGSSGDSDGEDPDEPQGEPESPFTSTEINEYQKWVKNGSEYPSAGNLKEGIRKVLERWHEPTKIGNRNSTLQPQPAIYYTRGSDIPIEIVGEDDKIGRAIEIPHGEEKNELYTDMLMIGADDSYIEEAGNLDTLRGWADKKAVGFRAELRQEVEEILPEQMTIEEFLMTTKFLIENMSRGEEEISEEVVFRKWTGVDDASPVSRNSSIRHELHEGMKEASKKFNMNAGDIDDLIDGFFRLKKGVVDRERLSEAMENAENRLDEYIEGLSKMNVSDLPEAYKIGTTRNNADSKLKTLLEMVADYAGEVEKLNQKVDVQELCSAEMGSYRSIYSIDHNEHGLRGMFDEFSDAMGVLDIQMKERWSEAGELLENGSSELDLSGFRETLDEFEDATAENGIEVMSLLYRYEESKSRGGAWKVYEAMAEMVEVIDGVEVDETDDFRDRVTELDEFDGFRDSRDEAIDITEGVNHG